MTTFATMMKKTLIVLLRQLICILISILCICQLMHCIQASDASRQNNRASRYRTTSFHQQQRSSSSSIDIKDKILDYQCYAKCGAEATVSNLEICHKQCKLDLVKLPRPGRCPSMHNAIFRNIAPLKKLACFDNCNYDFYCPEVEKCCESSCGFVCMDAIGVRDDSLLPPIPKVLELKLPRVGHKVEITIQSSADFTYYHVESRYHIGTLFSPRKLSAWQVQPVEKLAEKIFTNNKRIDISFNLRPGRWYQVRVAAINAHGFRGYSDPSKEFALKTNPKPPKQPLDLKVTSSTFDGQYYTVEIVWCPSKSNLPVEKYKIVWSLYVRSKEESFISTEAYVKDTHQFAIPELLPDSSYYIQVQAMSISGSRRLKSEKCSILYNTTTTTATETTTSAPLYTTTLKCTQQRHNHHHIQYEQEYNNQKINTNEIVHLNVTNAMNNTIMDNRSSLTTTATETTKAMMATYEVRFLLNRKFGMIVQIAGFHPHKEKVYELCPKDINCELREYSAIRAKKDSLEFSKLKYNTTYMLKALKTKDSNGSEATGSFTFTTPKCENFRKRFSKMQITC